MTKFSLLLLALVASLSSFAQGQKPDFSVALPVIPAYTVNLTEFGAKGNGATLCTDAFSKAMRHLAEKGGGKLVVPAGIWLTGPIQFESNVELHTETGALVLFTDDYNAYPETDVLYEGVTMHRKLSPLFAIDKENIAITGNGTFDGNGQAWRPVKKSKLTANQWKALVESGGSVEKDVWYPEIKERATKRPVLLDFHRCKRVLMQGVTFSNSPAWNVHPCVCEDVTIENVNIRNPWYAQNGDGLDLESCNRARIINTTFDVGDDAICIKSGKDKEGRLLGKPCQNVIISGCTVLHGHGGFVIGSEMSGGAKNIWVDNCVFNGTDVGLRFKSTRGRGGVVENIYINNVRMLNIDGDGMIFDLYYANKPAAGVADKDAAGNDVIPAVSEETPVFRNLYLENIICQGAKRAMYFNGLPEMPINNVVIKNSEFKANTGVVINYGESITFDNVLLSIANGKPMDCNFSKNILVK